MRGHRSGRDSSGLPARRSAALRDDDLPPPPRDAQGLPAASAGTIRAMAEAAAVARELEEIATQLAWVRDYL